MSFPDSVLIDVLLAEIKAEVLKAQEKFPQWPTDILHATAVVSEESGEMVKEALQAVYEPERSTISDVRKEAVQTGAMAVRWLLNYGNYELVQAHQMTDGYLNESPRKTVPAEET